ncbi:MAG: hypothetical protein GHCLOJNM_03239 [bacterium]|nr:hypothetical protein [bacterium]
MADNPAVRVSTFEGAALLRAEGFRFTGATLKNGRVILSFADPDGSASDLLLRHEVEGVSVNSLAFAESLRWAKDRTFAARREGGLE